MKWQTEIPNFPCHFAGREHHGNLTFNELKWWDDNEESELLVWIDDWNIERSIDKLAETFTHYIILDDVEDENKDENKNENDFSIFFEDLKYASKK